MALGVLKRGAYPTDLPFILVKSHGLSLEGEHALPPAPRNPGPFSITHLVMDETGHPPEADDRVSGLVGTVQGHTGLACQDSKGRLDAEDTLLAVNVKLEVSQAVRLVLNPQSLF